MTATDSLERAANGESPPRSGPQPGISGKRVTLIVLALLTAIGGTLSYALWSYGKLETIRKDKNAAWNELREPLAVRYRAIEKIVATGVDAATIPMEWGEQFRLALDRYQTTAQIADQYAAAIRVEELLGKVNWELPAAATNDSLTAAISDFNTHLQRESQQLQTPGCKLLGIFLSFREPGQFELAPASDDHP